MQGWYRYAADRPPLEHMSLETLLTEREELYNHIPTPGRLITIKVAPFFIDNNILVEEDVSKTVMWLRLHRAGGPSVMRDKHLRLWICAAKWKEHLNQGNWEKVVAIIQAGFRGGELAAPCTLQMVVMIPKGGGTDFRGIGLVKVLWKAIYGIINRLISSSIQFHDALHGFQVVIGKGTTTLEANMI